MPTQQNHNYMRPLWLCLACGEPWPCADRRDAFRARATGFVESTRVRAILGAIQFDAAQDLGLSTAEADARFTGWLSR